MRRQSLIVLAIAALTATSAWAENLKIEATPQGVKVQGNQFSAIAPRVSYDEAKGVLLLAGTKGSPAKFVRNRNGWNSNAVGTEIIYRVKEDRLTITSQGQFDESRETLNSGPSTIPDYRSSKPPQPNIDSVQLVRPVSSLETWIGAKSRRVSIHDESVEKAMQMDRITQPETSGSQNTR